MHTVQSCWVLLIAPRVLTVLAVIARDCMWPNNNLTALTCTTRWTNVRGAGALVQHARSPTHVRSVRCLTLGNLRFGSPGLVRRRSYMNNMHQRACADQVPTFKEDQDPARVRVYLSILRNPADAVALSCREDRSYRGSRAVKRRYPKAYQGGQRGRNRGLRFFPPGHRHPALGDSGGRGRKSWALAGLDMPLGWRNFGPKGEVRRSKS